MSGGAYADGSIQQGLFSPQRGAQSHTSLPRPVLGIVLYVRYADDPDNVSVLESRGLRGAMKTAVVQVLSDRVERFNILDDVLIFPDGLSGADDFDEDGPRGCSMFLEDGGPPQLPLALSPEKLDGEMVIVDFLGGTIDQPFVSKWAPHVANVRDPATSGFGGTLDQRGRRFKRIRGLRFTVTPEGTLVVDTNEAGAALKKDGTRERAAKGGDIRLDMKASRKLEVNFNETVDTPTSEPSLPQTNPPQGAERTRPDVATRLTYSKDFIEQVAGQVMKLFARAATDGVLLGGTPEQYRTTPALWEPVALGLKLKAKVDALASKLNALKSAFLAHTGHDSSKPATPTTLDPTLALPDAAGLDAAVDLSGQVRAR